MWVWQSQAPGGISKFTGVMGCAAFASAVRLGRATPAAIEASRRLRLLSMGRLLYFLDRLYSAAAVFARAMAPGSPAARAAMYVMIAHESEQAARKYSPASKLLVESLIQPTMNGPI